MRRLLPLAAALVFVAAGCGSKSTFATELAEVEEPIHRLALTVTTPSGASDPATLDRLADGFDAAAARLRELQPPADARDERDAFATELDGGADEVRAFADLLRGDDLKEAERVLEDRIAPRVENIGRTANALELAAG